MPLIGKVAPVPKGDWNSWTQYEKLNIVSHQNNVFIARKSSAGQAPVAGTTTEYWTFLLDSNGNVATTSTAGKVKPDGTTIEIDANGTISTSKGNIGLGNVDNTADADKTVLAANGIIDALDGAKSIQLGITNDGLLRVSWEE